MNFIDPDDIEVLVVQLGSQGAFDTNPHVRRTEVQFLINAMHRVTAKSPPSRQLVNAMAALIAGFVYHQPLRDAAGHPLAEANALVGLQAARLLAILNGHALMVTSTEPEFRAWLPTLGGNGFRPFIEWVDERTWPDENIAVVPTQLPLFGQTSDEEDLLLEQRLDFLPGVKAYVGSALTDLTPAALRDVEDLSDRVASALSASGVAVHQPSLHTHPEHQAHLSPREIHERDVLEVMDADLLVVIATAGSTGAGKEVAYSERSRALQLILVPNDRPLSRLVEGSTADVTVRRFSTLDDVTLIVADYVARREGDLLARRDARLARPAMFEPLLRSLADRFTPAELAAVAKAALMTVDRVNEILSSPVAFAAASVDDYAALSMAVDAVERARPGWTPRRELDPSRPTIGEREFLALEDAATLEAWDDGRRWRILTAARASLAASGTRRLRFASAQDWIAFARDLRG